MKFYIINGRVTINKLDDVSHRGDFVGYSATVGFIIYWNPERIFVIQIYHHVWFDECNYCISTEYNHYPGYLLLQQYPEIIIHNSDLLNLFPYELDLTSNPFSNTTIIPY